MQSDILSAGTDANAHAHAGTGGGESSYGLQTFSGQYTTATTTSGQSYRVDTFTNRPSFAAFQQNAAAAL